MGQQALAKELQVKLAERNRSNRKDLKLKAKAGAVPAQVDDEIANEEDKQHTAGSSHGVRYIICFHRPNRVTIHYDVSCVAVVWIRKDPFS
jgi:hypothetical protein